MGGGGGAEKFEQKQKVSWAKKSIYPRPFQHSQVKAIRILLQISTQRGAESEKASSKNILRNSVKRRKTITVSLKNILNVTRG